MGFTSVERKINTVCVCVLLEKLLKMLFHSLSYSLKLKLKINSNLRKPNKILLFSYLPFFPRDYQYDTVTLLNLILFKAADSTRAIYEVAMQLLQVCKLILFIIFFF